MLRLETRGVELAWEALGDASGPATVLVHETATGAAAWRAVAETLAGRGRRAIVYDRRGWGASTAPEGYAHTTVEEQSEDLADLIDALGPVSTVWGAGLGGLIALDLLLRHPGAAEGAVLVEPLVPGLVPSATEALSEDRERLRDAVQERGAAGMVETYLEGTLAALGPGAERLPARLTEPARERPGTLAAELGAASGWTRPVPSLAEAEQAFWIVTCGDTPPLLAEAAEALAQRLSDARLAEISEPGPPHVRAAEALAGIVTASTLR